MTETVRSVTESPPKVYGCGVLKNLIAALVVSVTLGCSNSNDDKALAVQECKDSVLAHLTYNADFPFLDPTPEIDSVGTWHVSGTVTAQTGFGAKRTRHWSCTVDSEDHVRSTIAG